ncbi:MULTISPECIES: hypothetical protein [unclassified Dysgonomonas]|uniref:hypothetical protein n=1 Tax=unclassified Dysgonomonas TaxID=2630389 RepID=UPI0006827C0A|nr:MULTISPECIES: hypothetical protein [unclassified Dysgonomonas]MBD8347038.1 hypothetical protein [Dysgonomonas sp. HGC4]MBF0574788.1 hypothetical protein [Dysgonomonas sp. GY617]
MKKILLAFGIICFSITGMAQNTKTDLIFDALNLKFSPEALADAKRDYDLANDTIKAIMLKVYSMPMSSKAELIQNYEERSVEIENLKDEFTKSIPKDFVVSLEIRTKGDLLHTVEGIDLQIFKKDSKGELKLVDGDWDIQYDSDELYTLLKIIGWDPMTFSGIKNMMQMANCISLQNGDQTEIGFARSGLGKYSYLIFPTPLLTVPQIKEFNDGCQYVYYKKNVVLKYTGGMAGPQCFTD